MVSVLHGKIRPAFAETYDLDEADGNVLPSVDIIVVNSQDPITVWVHVAIGRLRFVLRLSLDRGWTVEDDAGRRGFIEHNGRDR